MYIFQIEQKLKVDRVLYLIMSIILHSCVCFLCVSFLANTQALQYMKAISVKISVRHNMHNIRSHLQLLDNCFLTSAIYNLTAMNEKCRYVCMNRISLKIVLWRIINRYIKYIYHFKDMHTFLCTIFLKQICHSTLSHSYSLKSFAFQHLYR